MRVAVHPIRRTVDINIPRDEEILLFAILVNKGDRQSLRRPVAFGVSYQSTKGAVLFGLGGGVRNVAIVRLKASDVTSSSSHTVQIGDVS